MNEFNNQVESKNDNETLIKRSVERAAEIQSEMEKVYEDLHENPELGGQEVRTSGKVLKYLESLGIEVVGKNIGLNREGEKKSQGTGIVARISGKKSGPTIALRADMDALPILESKKNPHISKNDGVMHACGHDIHTTSLLGATKILKEMADKGELDGNVLLLFQPSEEQTYQKESGAVQMVKFLEEQGLRKDINAFFGLHVMRDMERGNINVKEGVQLASSGRIDISLQAKGGHVMNAYKSPNLSSIFSKIQTKLESVFKPKHDKGEMLVASTRVDYPKGGANVLPSSAQSPWVIRITSEGYKELKQEEITEIKSVVSEVLKESGQDEVTAAYTVAPGYRPTVHRDKALVDISKQTSKDVLGNPTLKEETIMGGEDFNFYMEELRGRQIPGVFMMVGGANEKAGIERGDHHTPDFRVDPKVLQEMSAIHASFVINYFNTIKNQKHD